MEKRLLVVDNDKGIRNVLQLSFESLGYKVFTAEGGDRGELLAHQLRPACIILDIMMPDKNGYLVCMDLKRDPSTADIPIILLTAKSLKDDIYWGYECGADAYVTKPYDPRRLEALVEQLINETEQGKRSVAWTGLPSDIKVLEEARARIQAGGKVFMAELAFSDHPKLAFILKNGQTKFRTLVHSVAWKMHEVVRDNATVGFVGQRPDDSFVLLVHPSEAERIESLLREATATAIDAHYEPKERAAGAMTILEQSPSDSTANIRREIPLLRLQWAPIDAERL